MIQLTMLLRLPAVQLLLCFVMRETPVPEEVLMFVNRAWEGKLEAVSS